MNKTEVYAFLDELGIWYEVTEHQAVFNMEEMSAVKLPYPEDVAKNLFVRDDKKKNYYLITVRGDKKVNLKEFRRANNTRALSFASDTDMMDIMVLIPGSVTPLGILNDMDCRVKFYMDEEFTKAPGIVGVHPNENTATVWLKTSDLLTIIEKHGNETHTVNLS